MSYNVNPVQLIQMIKSGKNPQQLHTHILEGQASSNPVTENLLNLIKQNRTADIETFARIYMASQGRNFDEEFNAFKKTYGLK